MKRIMAYILTLTMLCTLLSSCVGQLQESPQPPSSSSKTTAKASLPQEEYDEIANRLLDDWYRYLIRCEYLYGGMRWALSYADPYFEDHSWDSLQIARSALSSAKSIAESVAELPWEEKMTVQDYDKLVQTGADVSGFTGLSDRIQSLPHDVLLDYRVYQNELNSPADAVLLTYTLEAFEAWAHILHQIYDLLLHTTAVETDYLLLSLDSEQGETLFIECIAENCPQINALRKDNPQDPDALIELFTELTDEIAELDLSSVVGQFRANLDLELDMPQLDTDEGVESLHRHVQAMAADMVDDLTGFPTALPYPTWWHINADDNAEFHYYLNEPFYGEDHSRHFAIPNETIVSPPDFFTATWTGVSLEDYLLYVNNLEKTYDIPAQSSTKKEGVYTAIYELQPDVFSIVWDEEKVTFYTLEGSVCFGPAWYAYYTHCMAS